MVEIARTYRQRRIAHGLTQDQAAAAAGVTRRTLSDFEAGGHRISVGNLNRLLGAVGLELSIREAAPRPTLDELTDRYRGDETPPLRQRVRRKKDA
jgi:transcriptional regulator with XRE-family HTH domain